MSTACAYIRVSTDDQVEYSLDAQLNAIKKYAKENNLILPSEYVFVDDGYSGRKAEKRPAFMKMIATAKNKPTPFNTILVHKFDRFARNREDSVVYKSLLKKECNIKVVSITESIEDDKFSIILESMLEAMAEYYSLNLAEEVKKGMAEKAKRGEYQAYAPLGYDNDKTNKTLIINEEEAKIVKYIFNEFLNSTPMQQITKNLNDLGYRTKRGNKFERRTIEYILRNTVYIGYTTWCEDGQRKRDYTKPAHVVKGNYSSIIDEETFEKVQEKVNIYKERYKPKQRPITEFKHYLSGIVKCSYCGSSLSMGGKYTQCIGYSHGKCKVSNAIPIKTLERLFLEEISSIASRDLSTLNLKSRNEKSQNEETKLLNLELNKLNSKLERAKIAYLDGIDTLEDYKQNKTLIENQIENIRNKLNSFNENKEINLDEFKSNIEKLRKLIIDEKASNLDKIEYVKNCIEKIIFNKVSKTLEFYYYS